MRTGNVFRLSLSFMGCLTPELTDAGDNVYTRKFSMRGSLTPRPVE